MNFICSFSYVKNEIMRVGKDCKCFFSMYIHSSSQCTLLYILSAQPLTSMIGPDFTFSLQWVEIDYVIFDSWFQQTSKFSSSSFPLFLDSVDIITDMQNFVHNH